ncbi:DUF2834 domain-containing protein [Jatrophihabitans fulvus]
MNRGARATVAAYLVLAVAGLLGTWYFNLQFGGSQDFTVGNYLRGWFANSASSSAGVDLIVIVLVAWLLYARESRRLRLAWWVPILFAVLSVAVAVSFALPLFLAVREWRGDPDRVRRPGVPEIPRRSRR